MEVIKNATSPSKQIRIRINIHSSSKEKNEEINRKA